MSYRNLRFLEYGMTNAIHYKCEFACDSNPKRCNTIDIYTLAHTRKRRPQDVTENMYLNDNKCNALTEDGAIKTIWSGYYSQLLNETNTKGQLPNARNAEEEVPPISVEEIRKQLGKMKLDKTCDHT